MRAAVERLVRRWWAGELGWRGVAMNVAAAPLGWAWAGASRARAWRHRDGGTRVGRLTVVAVGNLAVGGTGKTPVGAWVARRLASAGTPTSVLCGGRGADEARLHERWNPDIPVLVARDRIAGATAAHAAGARAVVLDDGFQHARLARDLNIVLLSADDPFPGQVLPRGPYREPPTALARADALVVTRRAATDEAARGLAARAGRLAPDAVSAGLSMAPLALHPLASWAGSSFAGEGLRRPKGAAPELGAALAVCAVARAEAFRSAVRTLGGGPVELLAFEDHHGYTAADVARIRARAAGRPIVVTEKDAVKLTEHAGALGPAYVLTEELRWAWGQEALAELLDALVVESVRR